MVHDATDGANPTALGMAIAGAFGTGQLKQAGQQSGHNPTHQVRTFELALARGTQSFEGRSQRTKVRHCEELVATRGSRFKAQLECRTLDKRKIAFGG